MDPETRSTNSRGRRPPVLIVGAHRSGTSATAEALQLGGLQIGQRLDSHFEAKSLQQVHDDYLRRVGATWFNPQPLLDWLQTPEGMHDCVAYLQENVGRQFGRTFGYRNNLRGWYLLGRLKMGTPWGWKEPRTTLFAPAWLQVFPEAAIVDILRHPLAVALSIRQRELRFRAAGDSPNPQLDHLDFCLRLALKYVEAGERLARQTPRYRRVRFEDLQADPRGTVKQLAEFCGLRPSGAQLARAAAIIKPETSRHWQDLIKNETKDLRTNYPALRKLGYAWE